MSRLFSQFLPGGQLLAATSYLPSGTLILGFKIVSVLYII